jgi:dihydroxyacetone kinase-like protein
MAGSIRLHKEELTQLDSRIGDGDLGLTLDKGFSALADEAKRFEGSDPSSMLTKLGIVMNQTVPSTMGTLLAFGFLRAGRAVAGKKRLEATDVASILEAFADAIQERGKAQLGDKTILDALVPAQRAFASASEAGEDLITSWHRAGVAAEEGFARTVDMPSKSGRAAIFGEKTKGVPDPGAYACVILFRAMQCFHTSHEGE